MTILLSDRLTRLAHHRDPHRRTLRMRLTFLYGGLFLACGAALLAITYVLLAHTAWRPGSVRTLVRRAGAGAGFQPGHHVSSTGIAVLTSVAHGVRISDLHHLMIWSGVALAGMSIASILLGWIVAGRVLAPLRTITTTTREISAKNLHRRLALEGPNDELKDLGDTIDDLLARLETAFEAQKRFVANASHELRTPLTMMRTSVDVAVGKPQPPAEVRALAGKVGEGLDEADRILEGLLLLARAQRGALGDMTAVSIPDLIANAIAADQAEITRKRVDVGAQLLPATVMGNEVLLALMVANVIDNAVRHNVEEGLVHISNDFNGVVARLVIENGGDVLEENELQLLGEPFHRIGAERLAGGHGAGLGLSIVGAIAAAHGGALRLTARPEGGLSLDTPPEPARGFFELRPCQGVMGPPWRG